MVLTVASWNLDGWHTISDGQLELLDASGAGLLLAQEVTAASLERLREAGWVGASALELLADNHVERGGVRPRFACAVLTRAPVVLVEAAVLGDAPSPVRTLVSTVEVESQQVHAVSAALPPGSLWGRSAKQGQARVLAEHLAGRAGPVVVGMDRNGPKFERWDPADTVWWREDAPELFAADAAHGLADVLVTLHAHQPDRAGRARSVRPDGPLAVSYVERRANPPVERRYDVILASRHWHVAEVTYDYDGAVAAGSDHALVTARLQGA